MSAKTPLWVKPHGFISVTQLSIEIKYQRGCLRPVVAINGSEKLLRNMAIFGLPAEAGLKSCTMDSRTSSYGIWFSALLHALYLAGVGFRMAQL